MSKFNEQSKNNLDIYMGLFRLPQFETDILVCFNDPTNIRYVKQMTRHFRRGSRCALQDVYSKIMIYVKYFLIISITLTLNFELILLQ